MTETGHNSGHTGLDQIYDISDDVPDIKFPKTVILYVVRLRKKVKIGITKEPRKRVIQLECGCGEFFDKIYISPVLDNASEIEGMLHMYFQRCRGIGEWFHMPFEDAVHE